MPGSLLCLFCCFCCFCFWRVVYSALDFFIQINLICSLISSGGLIAKCHVICPWDVGFFGGYGFFGVARAGEGRWQGKETEKGVWRVPNLIQTAMPSTLPLGAHAYHDKTKVEGGRGERLEGKTG